MTLQVHCSLDFLNEPVPDKLILGGKVILGLTNNTTDLPNPPISIKTLQADTDAMQAAAGLAASGDHTEVAKLTGAVKIWNDDFRQTAIYVSSIANGNLVIIRESGYTPTQSESVPTPLPGVMVNFNVNPEKPKGTFTASADSMHNAAAYLLAAFPDGVTVAQNGDTLIFTVGTTNIYVIVDTHPKIHVGDLPSKVPLNVVMCAVNRAGAGPLTDSQEVTPQ